MEIRRRLRQKHVETAWVYGNTCQTTGDVLRQIMRDFGIDKKYQFPTDAAFMATFPTLIHGIARVSNVAIFIDELDHILEFDERQNHELLELLRGVSQHEHCRLFMAGFRRTMDASRRREHPLFNLSQNLIVAGLTRREISEMVTGPLTRLGFGVTPDLVAAIATETAGQPELIQIFGDVILRHFSPSSPLQPAEVLERVFDDDTFREKVLGTLLMNFNPMEKLSCYALFAAGEQEERDYGEFVFSLSDLDRVLTAEGIELSDTEQNILVRNLRAGGAIVEVSGNSP